MDQRYRLTKSEFVRAMQLHGRGSHITLSILALIGAVLMLVALFTDYKAIGIGGFVGGLLGYFVVLLITIPFSAKRQYKRNRALRSEICMRISEQGVSFKSEMGDSNLEWSDILKWKQGKEIYLLYVAGNILHIVPSTDTTNDHNLTELLNKHVGRKEA